MWTEQNIATELLIHESQGIGINSKSTLKCLLSKKICFSLCDSCYSAIIISTAAIFLCKSEAQATSRMMWCLQSKEFNPTILLRQRKQRLFVWSELQVLIFPKSYFPFFQWFSPLTKMTDLGHFYLRNMVIASSHWFWIYLTPASFLWGSWS